MYLSMREAYRGVLVCNPNQVSPVNPSLFRPIKRAEDRGMPPNHG